MNVEIDLYIGKKLSVPDVTPIFLDYNELSSQVKYMERIGQKAFFVVLYIGLRKKGDRPAKMRKLLAGEESPDRVEQGLERKLRAVVPVKRGEGLVMFRRKAGDGI